MAVVCCGHKDRFGAGLVEHLDIVAIELDAGRHQGFGPFYELRMGVGDGHELPVQFSGDVLEQAPHVVVVKPHDREASLAAARLCECYGRGKKTSACEQEQPGEHSAPSPSNI